MGDLVTMANSGGALEMGSLTPALMQSLKATEADLTDEQFALVEQFALGPKPPMVVAEPDELNRIITAIASVLKQPTVSIDHGKLKLAIYRKALARVPLVALQHAANIAIETLEWMPTPSELLKLARGHEGEAQRAHERANAMTRNRRQRMMDETLSAIARKDYPESELANLHPQWASIAETRALIVILMDGTRLYRNRDTIQRAQEDRDREFERMKREADEVASRARVNEPGLGGEE